MCVYVLSRSVMSDSLQPHRLQPARLLCPWNSPSKNTGVGCHSFLQGIFLTQESNLGLLHCGQILYHLSHNSSCSIVGETGAGGGSKMPTLHCVEVMELALGLTDSALGPLFTISPSGLHTSRKQHAEIQGWGSGCC